jgi:type IV conjugative transfer system lipoprotein TraV
MKIIQQLSFGCMGVGSLLLVGCTGISSKYECNVKDGAGIGCASMSRVNHEINDGQISPQMDDINAGSAITVSPMNHQSDQQARVLGFNPPASKKQIGYAAVFPESGQPVRYGEEVQRIWIGPYRDREANYFDASVVYTVTKKSHWIGYPVEAVQQDLFHFE